MSPAEAIVSIESRSPGAYGAAEIAQPGNGHVIGWMNDSGKAVFVDTQSGHIVTLSDDLIVKLGDSRHLP
jgi:hypothetical protein